MDTKPAPSGNDPEFKRPLGPTPPNTSTTPAPLGNFDFDREVDERPMNPGPLLQQKPLKPTKKSSAKTVIMVLLTILLLAAVAAAGYFYWQTMQTQNQVNQKQSQVESLTAENEKLKSDAAKLAEKTIETKPSTDKDVVTKLAEAYAASSLQNPTWVVQSVTTEANFAKVETGVKDTQEGGGRLILKKSKDQWVIIWSGTAGGVSETDKSTLKKEYGVPDTMLN